MIPQVTPSQIALQKDILLCTLNSTYQHSSFGLRYLYSQMAELTDQTEVIEWTIKENPRNVIEKILSFNPKIVGFGVYIWNTEEIFKVVSILKKVAPHIELILGGPEVSYETEPQRLYALADHIICGEADFSFAAFCRQHLAGVTSQTKIIRADLPNVLDLKMPYALYTADDIKNRVIYVEASRGCPYKCEYCLSSLDKSVRSFDLDYFLNEMQNLIDRGARTFKFVDRTFNLSPTTSTRILNFFLQQIHLGFFLHFEMVPDRLPQEIRELIKQFPAGSLQFEIGIQTLNIDVAKNISRNNNLAKVKENFHYLRTETHVHSHADLIVGLPGETLESFAAGFDQLNELGPDEVQVGILKRLKGTPIARHEVNFQLRYQDFAPFQILSTSTMDYNTLQLMNRFAKFWDLYANSGDFNHFVKHLKNLEGSFFWNFMNFVNYLSQQFNDTHSIALMNLAEKAWSYLMTHLNLNLEEASAIIKADFCNGAKKRDTPPFMKNQHLQKERISQILLADKSSLTKRQQHHLNNQ